MAAVARARRRSQSPWAKAGLRIEVGGQVGLADLGATFSRMRGVVALTLRPDRQMGEACSGAAQAARDIEQMAGAGSGAEQGLSAWNCAHQDDVGDGCRRLGQIAAGEGRL